MPALYGLSPGSSPQERVGQIRRIQQQWMTVGIPTSAPIQPDRQRQTRGSLLCSQLSADAVHAADPISGPIFPNKGDQERFWRMTRRFVEALAQQTGATRYKHSSS
jgi:hypothetical protein